MASCCAKKETEGERNLKKKLTLQYRHKAGTFVLFFSTADTLQMSEAGVWNVSSSLSLVCLCGGVSCHPPCILMYCASQRQQRQILSVALCRLVLLQMFPTSQIILCLVFEQYSQICLLFSCLKKKFKQFNYIPVRKEKIVLMLQQSKQCDKHLNRSILYWYYFI